MNEKQKQCSHVFLPTGHGKCHKCGATREQVHAHQRELLQGAQRRSVPGYDDGGTAQMRCPWCDGTVTWSKKAERTVVAVPYTEGDVYVPKQTQIRWSDMAHSVPACESFRQHAAMPPELKL